MTFTAMQTALTFTFNILATAGFIYIALSFIVCTSVHFKRSGKGRSPSQSVEAIADDNVGLLQQPQADKENDQTVIPLAEHHQVDRDWGRQFDKLTQHNTWEKALNTFVVA